MGDTTTQMGAFFVEAAMYQDSIVLCGSSSYTKKFYLDENFESLPEQVKEELKIMCVLYTEDIGGVLTLRYDEDGNLEFDVSHEENDYFFDEIGSVLKVKQLRNEKRDLLEALELYYKVFFLGEDVPEE